MVVNEKDARTAEVLLDSLQKILLEVIESNPTLSSNVDFSHPVFIRKLFVNATDEGNGIKGRVFTLKCRKVTN
jgi:hypothetical protein